MLSTLSDMKGILPKVEKALREARQSGRAGKTDLVESLSAFCDWCKARCCRGQTEKMRLKPNESSCPRCKGGDHGDSSTECK
jgi:hypothetical protein